jgi:hypothetical protein
LGLRVENALGAATGSSSSERQSEFSISFMANRISLISGL